jgi:hypothetical protein
MSSWPLVKYVDSPATTATVRYDFNDQAATPVKKATEFDPGVPTLEGDPDAVGQQWGFRSLSITHTIKGTKAQAMAQLSLVAREQLRRTNWLLFQPAAAQQPVWFKTYRTGYQPITLEQVYVRVDGGGMAALPDTWKIVVPLVADAFAYGARVAMSTAQVVQSPADLTSPTRTAMRVVLPAIKGDAPTPLRVVLTPAATSAAGINAAWLVGCLTGLASMSDPVVDIGLGDGLTAGAGTATGSSNTAFFSGSYRAVTISAGANFLQRLSGNLSAVPAGRYKVLLRYEVDSDPSANKTYLFAFGTAPTSSFAPTYGTSVQLTMPLATPTTVVYRGWVDLGEFTLPADVSVPRDTTDTLPAPNPVPYFALKIGTADSTAGAGLRIDAIKLIPIDGPTITSAKVVKATWSGRGNPPINAGGISMIGTFDGDSEAFWLTYLGGLYPSQPVLQGAYPVADPAAAQNLLILMALNHGNGYTAATATTTTKDAQVAVDVSYHPRYLHIGDGT